MSEVKKMNIVKVPHAETLEVPPKNFPRMPRLYLELLENKDKIKPQLINREYDPDDAETVASFDQPVEEETNAFQSNLEEIPEEEDELSLSENDENSLSTKDNSVVSLSQTSLEEMEENLEKDSQESKYDDEADVKSTISSLESQKMEARNKLKEILEEDDFGMAPKLSDLPYQQKKNVPNMDQMPEPFSMEEEEDLKRELLFKFELLKKSYKNVDIPEFSIHSSLKKMNESYENILRHVSLDSNVESYKNILIGGFMVFEFVLGQWLKFDMSGFTQQQILNMAQYERLLIELGEKSYVPEGKQWPVEVRLLGMIVMNAVIFIVSKMIMKQTGSDLMGMLNHFKPSVQASTSEPKKKMRGPSIDIDV